VKQALSTAGDDQKFLFNYVLLSGVTQYFDNASLVVNIRKGRCGKMKCRQILMRTPEEMRTLERLRRRWENNIKMG
jgi:hypothetical protein